jgi:hypothetical protein
MCQDECSICSRVKQDDKDHPIIPRWLQAEVTTPQNKTALGIFLSANFMLNLNVQFLPPRDQIRSVYSR